jgi:hypothetical protein
MSKKNKFTFKRFRKYVRQAEKELKHYTIPEKITTCKNLYKMYRNSYQGNVYLEILNKYIGYNETIKFVETIMKGEN